MSPALVDWFLILVGVGLPAGTALFVAAEFSFVAADSTQVSRRAANGDGFYLAVSAFDCGVERFGELGVASDGGRGRRGTFRGAFGA